MENKRISSSTEKQSREAATAGLPECTRTDTKEYEVTRTRSEV